MENKRKLKIGVDRGFSNAYKSFLEEIFEIEAVPFKNLLKTGENVSLLVFTGGEDVTPAYYNEDTGNKTNTNNLRDKEEFDIARMYSHLPKLGICRGSQFLTVLAGGKLIQHVNGHANGNHSIETSNRQIFEITSTHHQMMYPYILPYTSYEVIAWADTFKSDTYLDGANQEMDIPEMFLEPEIVYYKNKKALAIQGHPEASNCPNSTKKYILKLIEQYLTK